jgi:CBS domain-containing protein
MATIDSLMKTEMVTARADETVAHAAYMMATSGIGAVLVTEESKLAGILSERDILKLVGEGRDPARTKVGELATSYPTTVAPDTHVRDCSKLMRDEGFRHLPVVRGVEAVGIISARDLFGYVAGSLERVVDEEQYARALASGEDPYDHPGGSYGR